MLTNVTSGSGHMKLEEKARSGGIIVPVFYTSQCCKCTINSKETGASKNKYERLLYGGYVGTKKSCLFL